MSDKYIKKEDVIKIPKNGERFSCPNCGFKADWYIPDSTNIKKIRAEIAKPIQEECYYVGAAKIQADTIKWCLEIIDKYIGKGVTNET